jgi:hypothetical protein
MPITLTPISKSSSVSLTPISKSSAVSFTALSKSGSTSISVGESIGLLLALTHASPISSGSLTVTLISKS